MGSRSRREYRRAYYLANKEKSNERSRAYYRANKDRLLSAAQIREHKFKDATPKWLTPEQRRDINEWYSLARWLTQITGKLHTVDHIWPLNGKKSCGLHVPWNMQIMVGSENDSKWNKEPDQWSAKLPTIIGTEFEEPLSPIRTALTASEYSGNKTSMKLLLEFTATESCTPRIQ